MKTEKSDLVSLITPSIIAVIGVILMMVVGYFFVSLFM
jgi:hypothetical protein